MILAKKGEQITKREIQQEALSHAVNGQSVANYPAIFQGFAERGIPEEEIKPRENIFTYEAWRALGRQVRKGEHGVRVVTVISRTKTVKAEDGSEKEESYSVPWRTTVFHVSQTEVRQ